MYEPTGFNIHIKDNFLNQEDFDKIKVYAKNIFWRPSNLVYDLKNPHHVWFTENCSEDISNLLSKEVSKFFKVEILKVVTCQYSLVAKSKKTEVHHDGGGEHNFQTIIYIDGDENVHCGTGFYTKKEDNSFSLNTHVGFTPNRIVSWSSGSYHAPLSFTDDFKSRISIIAQYKIKEDNGRTSANK
mgnify:FL=1|jgi:hypothetical protein